MRVGLGGKVHKTTRRALSDNNLSLGGRISGGGGSVEQDSYKKEYSCKEKYRENIVKKVEKRHIELVFEENEGNFQLPSLTPFRKKN